MCVYNPLDCCTLFFPGIGRKAAVTSSRFLCPSILKVFLKCHDGILYIAFSEAYLQYFWYLSVKFLGMTMKNWMWRNELCFAFLCYGLCYIIRGKSKLLSILYMKNGDLLSQKKRNKSCCHFVLNISMQQVLKPQGLRKIKRKNVGSSIEKYMGCWLLTVNFQLPFS